MASQLAITGIAISARRRGLPSPMDGHRDIWFDVTVTVENPGTKPLHVISELRGLSYDAAQRALTLRLAEAPPAALTGNAPSYVLPTPATIMVEPHGTAKISVKVPAILKEARQVPGQPLALLETDLRTMQTIRCEVAASAKPIGPYERVDPQLLRTRLAKWGKIIRSESAVKPDTRD